MVFSVVEFLEMRAIQIHYKRAGFNTDEGCNA
jgi:hypothetical protein